MREGLSLTVQADRLRRGRRTVLAGVHFHSPLGLTAVLGPNGAGKSTLLEAVASLDESALTAVELGGVPLERRNRLALLARVGFVPQHDDLIGGFSVEDFIRYAAWLKCADKPTLTSAVERVLESVHLTSERKTRVSRLSGGMRQRASLAASLVHDPDVWILDEPTVGLDPGQRASFRSLLRVESTRRIVILSTHLVEDVAWSAGPCLVLGEGEMLFAGTLAELRERAPNISDTAEQVEAGYHAIIEPSSAAEPT